MDLKHIELELESKKENNTNENVAIKYDSDKPRYDLIPAEFLDSIARVLAYGAKKYSDRNWEKGFNYGRPYAALQRHLWAWWGGEDSDPETGESHLAHAACCLAMLVALKQRGTGVDDRKL